MDNLEEKTIKLGKYDTPISFMVENIGECDAVRIGRLFHIIDFCNNNKEGIGVYGCFKRLSEEMPLSVHTIRNMYYNGLK